MSDPITHLSDLYIYHIDGTCKITGRTNLGTNENEEGSFHDAVVKAQKNMDTLELSGKKCLGMDENGEAVYGNVTDLMELIKNAPAKTGPPPDMDIWELPIYELPSGIITCIPHDFYDWSKPPEYCYSYEDYQNRWANMGIDYEASCFDVTHASEFNEISREQYKNGFEGMSDEEIYRAVYERYQYCYGDNFLYSQTIEISRRGRVKICIYDFYEVRAAKSHRLRV